MNRLITVSLALLAAACCRPSSAVGTRADALDDSAWECSQWISVSDAPVVEGKIGTNRNNRAADGASWFLYSPCNSRRLVSAKWMTSGLGVYELYVNGKPVGEEALKPGFTHPEKTKLSFTYDITDAMKLKAGAVNVLSAQVTPGWWADKIVTPSGHDGMLGHRCAFRSVLELCYDDGSVELSGTDTEHWKAGVAGPVKHAAIFDGEEYDARELPGHATPEKLGVPEPNTEFGGKIFPSEGAEVYFREDIALPPVRAYVWKDASGAGDDAYGKVRILREYSGGKTMTLRPGETLVVDFGQNAAAVPSFRFRAKEGTVITCLPGEILNDGNGAFSRGMDGPEGSVHRTNLRTPADCFLLEYTFGPQRGYVDFRPGCTFFGYRYVSVTATDEVSIKKIESVPVTSIAKNLETGVVKTGNDLVNRLISNTVWGQRSNYLSVPTDCPQRNERLGWTADTQVFTETGAFFANTDAFFRKWMRDMRDSQSPTGGFPGVAPTAQYGGDMMRLGWADAGIVVPWTVWRQFGDAAMIDENWEAMDHFITHVDETRYDLAANKAENGNYQWADWLSYEPLESCGGGAFAPRDASGRRVPLPETIRYWNYLGACYWALDASMMRDMAAATGRDTGRFEAMHAAAVQFLRREFLTPDGCFKEQILNTMQTPALFALKLGLVEGPAKDAMTERLKANFAEHDGCLQTGFLGTSILMQTLTENGMSDLAYDLLLQRKNPSWLYSVDNGATTIWERWNSYTFEHGMGPKGMNSFNHYAYGCVCAWIWKTAAGIAADAAEPGFRHIIMSPIPDRRLGSLDASYRSAAGLIESSWSYDGDVWNWRFTVPEGSYATVTLPGEEKSSDFGPGTYTLSKEMPK